MVNPHENHKENPRHVAAARVAGALGAVWGFALVLASYPWIVTRAEPGDAVSIATQLGFDPSASFRLVVLAIVIPFVMATLAGLGARKWRHSGSSALIAFAIPVFVVLWITIELRHPTSFIIALLAPPLTVVLWSARRRQIRFDQWDWLLVPFGLEIYCIFMDLTTLHWVYAAMWAMTLTALIRIYVIPRFVDLEHQSLAVWLTPAAILPMSEHVPVSEKIMVLIGLISVSISLMAGIRILNRKGRETAVKWLLLLVLPIFAFFYPHAQDFGTLEGAPRVDLFEDGHGLLPASEWLRGERPYRDMVPGHGFLSDGGIDVIGIVIGGDRIASALWAHHWSQGLNPLAIYLLTLAATSSAPAALMSLLFSMTFFGTGTLFFRSAIPLLMLAATVAATRHRSMKWWSWSGAILPIAALSAIEFAAYSSFVTMVALLRTSSKRASMIAFGKGLVISGGPILVILLLVGLADDFVRVPLNQVINLGPVYNLGPGPIPELVLRSPHFPDIFRSIMFPHESRHLLWLVAVVAGAALFSASPHRAAKGEELLLISLWIALGAISWAERHHLYFQFALPSFIFVSMVILWRKNNSYARAASLAIGVMAVVAASPSQHLINQAILRTSEGPLSPAIMLEKPPRARGALFNPKDAELVTRFGELVEEHLGPNETWLDYANRPILHYLFDRDAAIRQYEVPFFQREDLQEEVIRHVRRTPEVRWVIMKFGHSEIDNVPNDERTPLVAEWIRQHFEPWYDDGEIIIWKRTG